MPGGLGRLLGLTGPGHLISKRSHTVECVPWARKNSQDKNRTAKGQLRACPSPRDCSGRGGAQSRKT